MVISMVALKNSIFHDELLKDYEAEHANPKKD